jgi:hypothetical protein
LNVYYSFTISFYSFEVVRETLRTNINYYTKAHREGTEGHKAVFKQALFNKCKLSKGLPIIFLRRTKDEIYSNPRMSALHNPIK